QEWPTSRYFPESWQDDIRRGTRRGSAWWTSAPRDDRGVVTTIALHEMIPGFGPGAEGAYDRLDHDLLVRAYKYSDAAHAGQVRHSGEPYVSHCIEVARILADLQLDTATVTSGLLHDIVEDTDITVEDIEREFGSEIAQIVDGLTKIANL